MSGNSKRRKTLNHDPSTKEKSALNALREVKKLQNSAKPRVVESITLAASGTVGKSAGSNDLSQKDPTGGSLQWYEKFHDEKLSNVETRIGAQATAKLYEVKGELEGKISDLRDSSNKHTTFIIVTIIITFLVGFLAFYFSAISSIESNVKSSITGSLNKLDNQVIELKRKVDDIAQKISKSAYSNKSFPATKADGPTEQNQPTAKIGADDL